MTTQCLDAVAVARVIDGSATANEIAHANSCAECSRTCRLIHDVVAADLRSEDIDAREAEADVLLAELLDVPVPKRPAAALHARYESPALARRFITLATSEYYRDLSNALSHIHVATTITGQLMRHMRNAAELEFVAWKYRSTIHRQRGENDSARAALIRARAVAGLCDGAELKNAIIAFADACICAEPDVWEPDQALELFERCESVFSYYEPWRLKDIVQMRGVVAWRSGDYDTALTAFRSVLAATSPADRATHADALRNLGMVLVDLRQADAAEDRLDEARKIDVELGRTTEVTRDDYHLARLQALRGQHDVAAELLADVSSRFASAGDLDAALRTGKDGALALIAAGRNTEARDVLSALVSQAVGSTERRRFTAEALSYLRQLADHDALTVDVATAVASYVDRIHAQRPVPFIPPFPIHSM